jgi:hypothetical protein
MRLLLTLTTALSLASAVASPETPPPSAQKTTSAAKKKPTATPGRIPVRVGSSTKTSLSTTSAKKAASTPRKPVAPQYARQAGPTPDRYRQIQESLASKGYLQSEPTGVWDQNSVVAMKKFQTDQKLDPTGKITSKALITLGLGPKDESAPPPSK